MNFFWTDLEWIDWELYYFFILAKCSSSAPAIIAPISTGQRSVNVSIGKEVAVNGDKGYSKGTGKPCLSLDLQEWYITYSYLDQVNF